MNTLPLFPYGKKYRKLSIGEVTKEGDWANSKKNDQTIEPPGGGWIQSLSVGQKVTNQYCFYIRKIKG